MTSAERSQFVVGQTFAAGPRVMSRERMRWYCDALETATDGDGFKIADPTIHTDDEYARSQGLPGIIADGMISTNWISGLLVRHFGMDYVARGELKTKFIRPIYEEEIVRTFAKVIAVSPCADGELVDLEVWCEVGEGTLCTVGEAHITVTEGGKYR